MGTAERIQGLDVARSWALLLALAAHVMVQVGMPMPSPLIGILIRTSTPIFILLFGAMIALVHLPRAERLGMQALTEKSWARALQCYLLFLVNVAALWIAVPYSARYALLCTTMLGSTPYAGILQYYTIMLAAMPLLVLLLRKVPLTLCLAVATVVHLVFPVLKAIPSPPPVMGQPILGRLVDLTVGTGTAIEIAGPSILHGMVLVFAGFALGRWCREGRAPFFRTALLPIGLLFLAMAVWSLSVTGYGPVDAHSLSGMRLRNLNHPAYAFIIGGIALALIIGSVVATRGHRIADGWLVLGRRSLFAFGFGNVVITFWPRLVTAMLGVRMSALLLLGVLVALIFAYDQAVRRGARMGDGGRSLPGMVHAVAAAADHFTRQAAGKAVLLLQPGRVSGAPRPLPMVEELS